MLATNEVHRIYICNDENKPIGLVSLKDLLNEILS